MTRNLKALGLALLAVCALGAVVAQGASAAETDHEFHAEKEKVVVTGSNEGLHKFSVGAVGTVECNKLQTESTQVGTKVTDTTWKTDKITVIPHYEECTFGGQPATVNFNHCAFVFDSETTPGNSTGGEHANVEIECADKEPGVKTSIEVHTAACTVTVPAQTITDAVHYDNTAGGKVTITATAKKIVVSKTRSTPTQPVNGCLVFPTGAIASYTGNATGECFEDVGSPQTGTDATTPTGKTSEGAAVKCTVSPGV